MVNTSKPNLLKVCLYGIIIGSLLGSFFTHEYLPSKHQFFWEMFPFFSAFYGFIGCIIIIFSSKLLGHYLQKKEDYYENLRKGKVSIND